jgi:hypothetical protein
VFVAGSTQFDRDSRRCRHGRIPRGVPQSFAIEYLIGLRIIRDVLRPRSRRYLAKRTVVLYLLDVRGRRPANPFRHPRGRGSGSRRRANAPGLRVCGPVPGPRASWEDTSTAHRDPTATRAARLVPAGAPAVRSPPSLIASHSSGPASVEPVSGLAATAAVGESTRTVAQGGQHRAVSRGVGVEALSVRPSVTTVVVLLLQGRALIESRFLAERRIRRQCPDGAPWRGEGGAPGICGCFTGRRVLGPGEPDTGWVWLSEQCARLLRYGDADGDHPRCLPSTPVRPRTVAFARRGRRFERANSGRRSIRRRSGGRVVPRAPGSDQL